MQSMLEIIFSNVVLLYILVYIDIQKCVSPHFYETWDFQSILICIVKYVSVQKTTNVIKFI